LVAGPSYKEVATKITIQNSVEAGDIEPLMPPAQSKILVKPVKPSKNKELIKGLRKNIQKP